MATDMTASVSTATRRVALLVVLVAQTAMFAALLPKPVIASEGDNYRYEVAGYNLARGYGLSLPYELQPDPDVRDWACSRHPAWCEGGRIPTAIYPPGYQFYIAAIYAAAGRSLSVLVLSQLILLLAMFVVFEKVAAKYLARPGYLFAMIIAATYPFLAHQAGRVMSDHLHSALLWFALALLLLRPASWWRGGAAGVLFGAATLTRPYSFICIPFVALTLLWKPRSDQWRADWAGWWLGVGVLLGGWIIRNEIVFGRFIPFTTAGLGMSLYYNKLEWTIGSSIDGTNFQRGIDEILRVAVDDPYTWRANRTMTAAALAWIGEHPWAVLALLPMRVVRLWVSIGKSGEGLSRAWPLLVSYLGGLLVLGVGGLWIGRRRREIVLIASIVLPYCAFLLHTTAEARRTLPLRLPMLLCAGVAIDALFASPFAQRILTKLRARLGPRVRGLVAGSPSSGF